MAGTSPAYGGPKSFHPDQNCNDITAYLYVNLIKNIHINQYFIYKIFEYLEYTLFFLFLRQKETFSHTLGTFNFKGINRFMIFIAEDFTSIDTTLFHPAHIYKFRTIQYFFYFQELIHINIF